MFLAIISSACRMNRLLICWHYSTRDPQKVALVPSNDRVKR